MKVFHQFTQIVLIPALIGIFIATGILLWNPDQAFSPVRNKIAQFISTDTRVTPPAFNPQLAAPTSYAEAVDKAAPAVVNIYTQKVIQRQRHPLFDDPMFQRFFQRSPVPQSRVESSLGSGVIMNASGYILTNNHVISGADEIVVALHDGREARAAIVGTDADADLAVLKIELPELPFIKVANSQNISIGDVVLAIGNPFGVGQTVTMGIVSAKGRNQLGINTYEDYIQTDAAINPGNSGGALINAFGELVGINSAIYSKSGGSQGIGFAIPSNNAIQVLGDIARYGYTIRGWVGIQVQEITPALLLQLNLPDQLKGLIVTSTHPDGPSAKAGLQAGDILVSLDGMKTNNAKMAMNLVGSLRPLQKLSVEYIRAGKTYKTTITVGQKLP